MMKWWRRIGILFGAAVVGMSFFSGTPVAMAAGLFSPTGGGASSEPTEIVSDRLVNNNTEKVAEFTGSVKATQGTFSITADTLRIHYEGDLINPPKDKSAKSQVTKMVAIGHVHIISDQYTADSERAEYDPASDVLTLIGENSRATSGENSVTGSKIIINRRDGKSFAEGSGTSRVKAVLHQSPKEGEGAKKEGEASKADKPAVKKQ
jgi:lipopolysaccharide export system protein LptA